MAMFVRNEEGLLTIQLSLLQRPDGAEVLAQPWRGAEPLADPVRLRLDALGLDPGTTEPRDVVPLPATLRDLFATADAAARPDEHLWLLLAYGADALAAYPWEAQLEHILHRALLRVPNFVANSFKPESTRPVVIVAPLTDPRFTDEVAATVRMLMTCIAAATPQPIHVFTDLDLTPLQAHAATLPPMFGAAPMVSLHFTGFSPDAPPDASRRPGMAWLEWVERTLPDTGAHTLYIVGRGAVAEGQGGLALPVSLHATVDRPRLALIDAARLARALDRLKVQALGMTAMGGPASHAGLRLLANAVTWQRPGPVILAEGSAVETTGALKALLGGWQLPVSAHPGTTLSAHPRALDLGPPDESRGWPQDALGMRAVPETPVEATPEVAQGYGRLSSLRPRSIKGQARDEGERRAMDLIARMSGTIEGER